MAATWYILGVRPDYEGLVVDPCIPRKWDGFTVKRRFRKTLYDIEVINPHPISKGVRSIVVDGQEIKGNILPQFSDKKLHKVKVMMET